MSAELFGTLFFLVTVILCVIIGVIKDKKGKDCDTWMSVALVSSGCMSVHLINLILGKTTIEVDELEQLRQAAETLAQIQ